MAGLRILFAALVASALVLPAGKAWSITVDDLFEKMTEKERLMYITGLVDMLVYQLEAGGDRSRAECVYNEYYNNHVVTWNRIVAYLGRYQLLPPQNVVAAFLKEKCGAN